MNIKSVLRSMLILISIFATIFVLNLVRFRPMFRVIKSHIIFLLISVLIFPSLAWGANYYVDATNGSDSNNGLSPETAWKTISKVNGSSFSPGDSILFKRGEIWKEQLIPPSSGTGGNPITFGAYGSGSNPQISLSKIFNNWWQDSLIANGGFEEYTIGSPNDNFAYPWGELNSGTGSVKAETNNPLDGLASAKCILPGGTSSTAYIRLLNMGASGDTTYFVQFNGRIDQGSRIPNVRIKDSDNYYLQSDGTWTAAGVNWATVNSTTKQVYSISFTTRSGITNLSFYFGYITATTDSGTSYFDNFVWVEGSSYPSAKIWAGYDPGIYEPVGAKEVGGSRVEQESKYNNLNTFALRLANIDNNEFYFNNIGGAYHFFYRNDSWSSPQNLLVGNRPYGIHISGKSYIVIENIDVLDPAGREDSGTYVYAGIYMDTNSDHIIVKNLKIYDVGGGTGIFADYTTSNITYDSLEVFNNGKDGIYMNSQNSSGTGYIRNCKSYHNQNLISDTTGDGCGIGIQGGNIYIQNNEVYGNGRPGANVDFEISVVRADVATNDPVYILYNYIHDAGCGAIQIIGSGATYAPNNSVVAYNIIDGFGSDGATGESAGKYSGIRIGSGTGVQPSGVKVYNNIIMNGSMAGGSNYRAGVFVANSSGTDPTDVKAKNNIFYNNACYDVYVQNIDDSTGFEFSNNIYYKADYTNNWYFKTGAYSTLSSWQAAVDFAIKDVNSMTSDPLFRSPTDFRLQLTSPAINAGIDVGLTSDFEGSRVSYGSAPDIGAYEYNLWAPDPIVTPVRSVIGGKVAVPVTSSSEGGHQYNYAYVGGGSGTVYKISLSSFSVVDSLSVPGINLYFGDIDLKRNKLLLGGNHATLGIAIFFIDLATFTYEGLVSFESDEQGILSIIIDQTNGIAYCAESSNNYVIKVDIPTRTRIPGRLQPSGAFGLGINYNGAIDPSYVYFADNYNPPRLHRVRISDFSDGGYVEFGDINKKGGTGRHGEETDLGLIYFVAINRYGYNDTLVRFDTSTFTVSGSIDLNTYEVNTMAIGVDPINRFLYLSVTDNAVGKTNIVKFNLSTFSRVTHLVSDGSVQDLFYDPKRNLVFLGGGSFSSYPGCDFHKVNPSTMTVIGGLTIGEAPLCVFTD